MIRNMCDRQLTRSYLETLSTHELVVLADVSGIDIPPGLDRIFIIESLVDEEDEFQDEEEMPLEEAEFSESVVLPKQYNITSIDVLIRDPLWAFAFWEIKTADRELHENALDFGGYALTVLSLKNGRAHGGGFRVAVGIADTGWYLGFPPGEGWYMVELSVLRREEPLTLASSPPFRLPPVLGPRECGTPSPADPESPGQALVRLSGLDDFTILRNTDRKSRIPRCIYE